MIRPRSRRVFISYAHDTQEHVEDVRQLYDFLRTNGIDAVIDGPAAEQRQDWTQWMVRQLEAADFILVIVSPEYRRRDQGTAPANVGRGIRWEAALIREMLYSDREKYFPRILPVVLPGRSSSEVPTWLLPTAGASYAVEEFTVRGAERLLRLRSELLDHGGAGSGHEGVRWEPGFQR
jgi:hypothetical protein